VKIKIVPKAPELTEEEQAEIDERVADVEAYEKCELPAFIHELTLYGDFPTAEQLLEGLSYMFWHGRPAGGGIPEIPQALWIPEIAMIMDKAIQDGTASKDFVSSVIHLEYTMFTKGKIK